jgi:hypothetical protein
MFNRLSPTLWVSVTVLLASIVIVPLAYPLLRPSVPPPHTLTELTELLRQADPSLCAVAMTDLGLEDGVYFCERPQPREQLLRLLRAPECAHRWKGVVYCDRSSGLAQIPADQLHSWGEHGMQVGPLVFFGDPALLRRIETAIRKQ